MVDGNQFRDAHPVRGHDGFREEIPGREVTEKPHFCMPAETFFEKVGNLGHDKLRNDQRAFV